MDPTTISQTVPPTVDACEPGATPTRKLSTWWAFAFVLVIAGLLTLTRLPFAASARTHVVWNVDELEMTYATLDRIAGVPPTTLAKPGGPLQMVAIPWIGLRFGFSEYARNTGGFLDYLGEQYLRPWSVLLSLRIAVVAITSIALAVWWLACTRRFGGLAASAGTLVLATWPAFALHSHLAVPDSMALGLVALGLAINNGGGKSNHHTLWAGILLGLAVATKVTMVVLVPWFLTLALWEIKSSRAFRCILALGGMMIGLLLGCPHIWIDPLRLAKAVLGNATKPGDALGVAGALGALLEMVPLWLLIPAAVSLLRAAAARRWQYVFSIAFAGAILFASGVRAAVFFPRYYFPLLLPLTLLIMEEVHWWMCWARQRASSSRRWMITSTVCALAGACIGLSSYAYYRQVRLPPDWNRAAVELAADLSGEAPGSRLLVPGELLPFVAADANPASFERLVRRCEDDMQKGAALGDFAEERHVSSDLVRVIPSAFSEREQAFVARLRLLAHAAPGDGLDISFWQPDEIARRGGFVTETEARSSLGSSQYDRVVLKSPMPKSEPLSVYGAIYYGYATSPDATSPR